MHDLWSHQRSKLFKRFFLPTLVAIGHSWTMTPIWPWLTPAWHLTPSMHYTSVKDSSYRVQPYFFHLSPDTIGCENTVHLFIMFIAFYYDYEWTHHQAQVNCCMLLYQALFKRFTSRPKCLTTWQEVLAKLGCTSTQDCTHIKYNEIQRWILRELKWVVC